MLINVVLPKPDSPATMMVKAAPLLATILWRWLGRFAIPIGDALSEVGGAIADSRVADSIAFESDLNRGFVAS